MKLKTLLLFSAISFNILAQPKQLISKDSIKATYTVLNNDIRNARRASVSIGLVFAEFQYFNYQKYVIGLVASAYGGLRADYSYCFKNGSRTKPELVYLGRTYENFGKMTDYYTRDSVIVNKMHCLHGGLIYAPLLLDAGNFVTSPGIQFGYRRFKTMVNKYKSKSRDFNLTAEKTFRKGFSVDMLYFPTFNFKQTKDQVTTSVSDKNVFGLMIGFHGSAIRRRDPRQHQGGVAWRAGVGYTFNGHVFMDLGYGFSF